MGGPHSVVAGVEPKVEMATRSDEYHPARLSGPELLNDFVEQGKRWKHVLRPPLPVL